MGIEPVTSCSQVLYSTDRAIGIGLIKLKAFLGNNFSVAKMVQYFFENVENIVGKEEDAGSSAFPTTFSEGFFPSNVKSLHCMVHSRLKWSVDVIISILPKCFLRCLLQVCSVYINPLTHNPKFKRP